MSDLRSVSQIEFRASNIGDFQILDWNKGILDIHIGRRLSSSVSFCRGPSEERRSEN